MTFTRINTLEFIEASVIDCHGSLRLETHIVPADNFVAPADVSPREFIDIVFVAWQNNQIRARASGNDCGNERKWSEIEMKNTVFLHIGRNKVIKTAD